MSNNFLEWLNAVLLSEKSVPFPRLTAGERHVV